MVECSIKDFGSELLIFIYSYLLREVFHCPYLPPAPRVFTHCKAVLAPGPVPPAHSQLATC